MCKIRSACTLSTACIASLDVNILSLLSNDSEPTLNSSDIWLMKTSVLEQKGHVYGQKPPSASTLGFRSLPKRVVT